MMTFPLLKSFIKFLLVGVLNTCVGLGITYLALEGLHLNYWLSTSLGNGCGAVVSFFLNRRFTFQSKVSYLRSLFRFGFVILVCYYLSFQAGLLLSSWALESWDPTIQKEAAVLIGSGLYTVTNFLGQRWFVFPESSPLDLPKET